MTHRLTRHTYDQIRAARDAHTRALFADEPDRCSGCRGEYRNVTAGCGACWDRERRRKRRQDPVKHAQDLALWREGGNRKSARRRERLAAA